MHLNTLGICDVYFCYSDRAEMTACEVLEMLVKQTLQRLADGREFMGRSVAYHLESAGDVLDFEQGGVGSQQKVSHTSAASSSAC